MFVDNLPGDDLSSPVEDHGEGLGGLYGGHSLVRAG